MWRALHNATQMITVVSDSKYTVDTANGILKNHTTEHRGQHRDIWNHIIKLAHKLHSIRWIKAHTTPEQAEIRGMRADEREGNLKADELATKGTQLHDENNEIVDKFKKN